MTAGDSSPRSVSVPELGPSLGRLVSAAAPAARDFSIDDLRLGLATAALELGGLARTRAAAGDRGGALQALSRASWLEVWERSAHLAADRVANALNGRLESAAAESRMPPRLRRRLPLASGKLRQIRARFGAAGSAFVTALDGLEETVAPLRVAPASDRVAEEIWQDALLAAVRRLESAWLALDEAADKEWLAWKEEIDQVRQWRRPVWPLWLGTAALLGAAVWVGLVLGGYLDCPWWFRPAAEAWWGMEAQIRGLGT